MANPPKNSKSPKNPKADDPLAGIKTSVAGVKTWWGKQTQQNKLLIGGGGGLFLLLLIAALANSGGNGDGGYNPYGPGYAGGYQGQGGYQGYAGQGYAGQGYAGQGYAGQAPAYGQPAGQAGGDDPTGYWARQRSQEQSARAYDQTIRETDTVRNNDTGEVTTDVPNAYADPAIQSGGYSEVPTPELPTTTPAPEAAPAE